ncbi:ARID DNA-binding domain-containing protein, partial [Tanacetum coccineum]
GNSGIVGNFGNSGSGSFGSSGFRISGTIGLGISGTAAFGISGNVGFGSSGTSGFGTSGNAGLCPNKKNRTIVEVPAKDNNSKKPTVMRTKENLKYPERVHVITDYMIEGRDYSNWDNIWYVSSAYKKHMCPTKSLFKKLKTSFKVEGTQHEKKFILSHGVGEAKVETKDKKLVIPYVLYTPETTLNVLSFYQLKDQGYVVKYGHNKCSITYMFDDKKSVVAKQNKYLDAYFDSIDPKKECSLIKGFEDLNWDTNEVQEYLDEDYISMNGTLKRFLDMIKWFYLVYLNQDVLEPLPPVIGNVEVDFLGLYKMIDSMGGYLSVTFGNKWKEVAVIHGLTEAHEDELKSFYKCTIEMVKCYYDTTMKPWFREEPVITKMVEGGRDYAKKENPQGCDGLEIGIENTCQGNKTRFGVNLEGTKLRLLTMRLIKKTVQAHLEIQSRSRSFSQAVDVVSFTDKDQELNAHKTESLKAFVAAVDKDNNSHFAHVPRHSSVCKILVSSNILSPPEAEAVPSIEEEIKNHHSQNREEEVVSSSP